MGRSWIIHWAKSVQMHCKSLSFHAVQDSQDASLHVSRSPSAVHGTNRRGCQGIQADREAKAQAERARLRTKNGSLFFRQFFSYLKLWLSFPVIPIFLQPFSMWIVSGCGLILQMPHFRSTWTGGSKESAGRKACRRGDTDFFPSSFEWTKYERLGLKTHISHQRHDVFVYRLQYRWDCRKHAAGRRMSSADVKMSNADVKRRRQSSMFCTARTELEACSNLKKLRQVCRSRFVLKALAFHVWIGLQVWRPKRMIGAAAADAWELPERTVYCKDANCHPINSWSTSISPSVWTRKIWLQNHGSWLLSKFQQAKIKLEPPKSNVCCL